MSVATHHRGLWTDEDRARLREIYLDHTEDELRDLFPGRSWESIRKAAYREGLRRPRKASEKPARIARPTTRPMSPAVLEPVEQYLAEWRTLDFMEPRSAREGWRDAGAIHQATGIADMGRIVSACERLADLGVLEVRCGESGWIFYRFRSRKA